MTTNTVFQLRRNSVSGTRPTTTTVAPGELAINTTDGILFSANSTAIFEIGANNTSIAVGNSTVRQTANSTGVYVNGSLVVTGNASVTANLVIASTGELIIANGAGIQANGSFGTAGDVLYSNSTGVYWANTSAALSEVVTQQFTANGTANSFLVSGGYFPNAIEVYLAGVKQIPGVDVTLTSGSTVNFAVAPLTGQIVDVFGYKAANNIQSISAIVSQQFTANGTANTFTITPGYIPNAIEVYVSGVKRVPVTDVDITSGSTITFTTAPLNGQIVDVFGYRSVGAVAPFIDTTGGTMTGNLRFNNTAVIIANGSFGTNGQVLTSNGTSMYWSSAGFTNGQSISVNNFIVTGAFTANSSNGSAGQVLSSNGTGVYWATAPTATSVRQTFTANATVNTTFTVTGGYTVGFVDVYKNGIKLINGTDVTVSSGSTVVLAAPAISGEIVDVVGALTGSLTGVTTAGAQTLTNKRIDPRVSSTASASSVTPDISSFDMYVYTALAAGLTINATTGGSPVNGSKLVFRFKDNGTARALTWTTSGSNSFRAVGVTLPTTTVIGKVTYVGCIYNADESFWDVIAAVTQA